jgi:single-stranded DNA-binding protein
MQGLNRVYLIGAITTVEACKDGKLVVAMATPHAKKVDGEWAEDRMVHELESTGREAEFIARYAKVGDVLAVECTIVPHRTVDRKGDGVYGIILRLERVLSLSGRSKSEVIDG